MKTRVSTAAAVLLAASAGLGGCVSLLPKSEPAQLYRFEYRPAPGAPTIAGADCDRGRQTGVIATPPELPRAAAGDQILTFSGDEAAYVFASRWVAPARSLFDDAVEEAFQSSCAVRLVRRQDFGAGSVRLRLDIDRFEAVYPAGTSQKGKEAANAPPPVVTVSLKATLMNRGGDFGAEQLFRASQPAAENRVGAIVAAYSAAATQALTQVVGWTDSHAPEISARQDGPRPVMARPAPALGTRSTTTSTTSTSTSVQPQR